MDLWNRLRHLAEGIFAGGDARPATDDAIYLTETAYHNRQPTPTSAPDIRERHFGLGSRRERAARNAAAPAAGSESGSYAGTKIVGKPHKPSKPAVEAPIVKVDPPTALPAEARMPAPRVEAAKSPPPRPAPTPATTPAPARTLAPDDDATLRRLFGDPQEKTPKAVAPAPAPAPVRVAKAKKKTMDRGDVIVAALGVTLAVVCAVFPWYIFFNQEKFGVREFVFSGNGQMSRSAPSGHVAAPVGKPFASAEVPKMELDFFPTATLPSARDARRAVPASEQPFPSDRVEFRLIHVANGRAMIEDADGLWVVQRGSRLPDASVVAAIEQRGGRWVIVTTHDKVVELGSN